MDPHADEAAGRSPEPIAALEPIALVPLLAFTIALIVVAAVFMRSGNLNIEVFTALQGVTRAWPDPLWAMVTICGEGVVAFALLSPTLAWRPRWFAAAIVAASLAGAYSNGMKHLFGLPRPASVLDPVHLHVIGHALRANTFPSGHSVTAFTLASLLVFASKAPLRTALWAVPAATLIALSRVAVGAHWPADLAAGAAGGWVCGALGVAAIDRWRRWNTIDGIRVMGVISIGIGVSLFIVDVGYPQAIALQSVAGAVAIVAGIVACARPRPDPALPYLPSAVPSANA